jgi:hypothetical protein
MTGMNANDSARTAPAATIAQRGHARSSSIEMNAISRSGTT